jgi:hypothetical protein
MASWTRSISRRERRVRLHTALCLLLPELF